MNGLCASHGHAHVLYPHYRLPVSRVLMRTGNGQLHAADGLDTACSLAILQNLRSDMGMGYLAVEPKASRVHTQSVSLHAGKACTSLGCFPLTYCPR